MQKGKLNMSNPIEKTLETPYGIIHYRTSYTDPTKPWLIFLPGLTADHHLFDKQVEELSKKYKRKYYSRWELALLKRTKWMYLSIPWKLLVRWGSNGTAVSVYGRQLMKQTMASFEKTEYCELADHGYRILAEAVESDRSYDLNCPVLLLCGKKDAAGSAKSYNRRWTKQDGHPLV